MSDQPALSYGQLKRQTQAWRKATGLDHIIVPPKLLELERTERTLLVSISVAKSGSEVARLEADLQNVRTQIRILKQQSLTKPL